MSRHDEAAEERRVASLALTRLDKIIAIQAQLADAELDLDRFLDDMLERMRDEFAATGAVLVLRDNSDLIIKAAAGSATKGLGARLKPESSLCGLCMSTGETLVSDNCEIDPRIDQDALKLLGARSAICTPLARNKTTFGAVMLVSPEHSVFHAVHSHILRLMAGLLSVAFEHRVRYDANRELMAQQKRTLEALAEAETRFRGSFETAAHGMALVSPEGRFIEVNQALCRMVGYTEAELIATDFQSITHPADLTADLEYVQALLAGEIASYHMEKRYRHKEGHAVWVVLAVSLVRSSDGAPRYFVTQIQDISGQKRIEEAQRRYEDRFKELIEGVTDYAIYTLHPDGKIMSWNAGAERIKRYVAEEVVGRHFEIFCAPDARAKDEAKQMLEIAARDGKFEGICERVRADGSRYSARVVLDAVRANYGEVIGYTVITRDVDSEKTAIDAPHATIAPTAWRH